MPNGILQRILENVSVRLDTVLVEDSADGSVIVAEALPGTALAEAKWRVRRETKAVDGTVTTSTVRWCGGSSDFEFPADDLPSLFS
jgi:hypothetical protein